MPFFNRNTAGLTAIFAGEGNPTLLGPTGAAVGYQDGDGTDPVLQSGVVPASGSTLRLFFDAAVDGYSGFSLEAASGTALAYSTGDGTATLVFTTSRTITSGEALLLSYDRGDVADAADNVLPPFYRTTVTNGSVV